MSDAEIAFDDVYREMLEKAKKADPKTDEAKAILQNLRLLNDSRPPKSEPEPEEVPEPTTVLGKLKVSMTGVWDNETTRVLIKAGGAFAGVALVTWATVHRDHVLLKEPLSQANQRPG